MEEPMSTFYVDVGETYPGDFFLAMCPEEVKPLDLVFYTSRGKFMALGFVPSPGYAPGYGSVVAPGYVPKKIVHLELDARSLFLAVAFVDLHAEMDARLRRLENANDARGG
jgi:hypothetical protein